MALLECQNLSCERGGRVLFAGLDVAVEKGHLLALTGRNGSGKSSILRMIAGLLDPASGQILYDGTPIDSIESYASHVHYVGHKLAVRRDHTVEQNLKLWLSLGGEATLLDAAIDYFDLTPFRDAPCSILSAGWLQRVALARLLLMPAKVWLLDEPTSHLDEEGMALLSSLMQTRIEQGGLVVMATHMEPQKSDKIKILNISEINNDIKVIH